MALPRTERIEILTADITTLALDAIVNAANEALAPGGGDRGCYGRCHRMPRCEIGAGARGVLLLRRNHGGGLLVRAARRRALTSISGILWTSTQRGVVIERTDAGPSMDKVLTGA